MRLNAKACRIGCLFAALATDAAFGAMDIQREIDACAARGGGRVTVPSGTYRTRSLELKSNVELHLDKGAIIEGLPGMENYRKYRFAHFEGDAMAVVACVAQTNVAITGEGEIYGAGADWPIPRGEDLPPGVLTESLRPRGILFVDCRDVRLEGIRFTDAACWGVVFYRCDGVDVHGVTVDNMANTNGDGMDIEARNFRMTDCEIQGGDDAVCFKANDPGFTSENIYVSNVIARTHCYNFKLGTATRGIMRNFLITDCRAEPPRRFCVDRRKGHDLVLEGRPNWPLWIGHGSYPGASEERPGHGLSRSAIAITCVDGGIVEDIVFRNMDLEGACTPFFIRAGLRPSRPNCPSRPASHRILRRILLENITGRAESFTANSITGVEGCRAKDITLRNVRLVCKGGGDTAAERTRPVPEVPGKYPNSSMFDDQMLPAYGLYIRHADNVRLENVEFQLAEGTSDARDAIVREDVR